MTFCIITHVVHACKDNKFYGYSPYINEMNLWIKHVDRLIVVAPISNFQIGSIHNYYNHNNIDFIPIQSFNTLSGFQIFRSIWIVVTNSFLILKCIKKADHIHLRCPGNIGLLGCFLQILFPNKMKTAKYAGNWEPKAKQPFSYRIQKYILNNTFLTKNIKVLVYGEWANQSKNIKSFFTATYSETDKKDFVSRDFNGKIFFLFVGMLTSGKRPLYAVQLVENLYNKGFNVQLDLYGEGNEGLKIEQYIKDKQMSSYVYLRGNQEKETVKKAYEKSHFLVLPSQSEGWPKVVAEAMFWGCVPIASSVSCISYMLDYGNRGVLLKMDMIKDVEQIIEIIYDFSKRNDLSVRALNWSRRFTVDKFENEIKTLLEK